MKKILASLAIAFALVACQGVQHNTASGRPEVTTRKSVEVVKNSAINELINHGYAVTADTPYSMTFEKPVENPVAAALLGSQWNSVPNARIRLTFAKVPAGTRVVADLAFVTNPGTGFERLTPANNNPDSVKIQEWLAAL
ncbi:hypothetical protein H2509_08625 [Stappia sp. F7233]|uniref:Lipoprotein n=1 Tax=Stappia albiluteola TaxID=2758565 RepID=A0A839AF48_9HYPH|nr:hypothetical protein [Stappia albiluteola]MBA5777189.1 hypothetical protein [Stappia albiluteola]